MSDDNAGQQGSAGEFRRERSQPLPPERRRSPRSGRFTVPSAGARRRRTGLLLMSALSVLVLLASGISWGATEWVSGNINRSDVFGGLAEDDRPDNDSGALTFLVIGSDGRDDMSSEDQNALSVGSTPGQRSDAIMLVHLNHDRDRVTVVGLPRDLWVDIPGEGEDKINAAYAYGGPQKSVETVESVTGVRIDHYVEVDFTGFVDVVDSLGGVEVCLEEDIEDPKAKLDLEAGTHEVDGTEALAFSRTRATERGDLDRIDRQQQVVAAMMDRALSTETLSDPAKLTSFLQTSLSSLTVDESLDTAALNELGHQMRGLDLGAVDFAQVPIADMEHWTERGDVAVLWDEPAARDLFADIQADRPVGDEEEAAAEDEDSEPTPTDIPVRVFNGTASPGVGAELDAQLSQAGFELTGEAENWTSRDLAGTQVRYGPDMAEEAAYVSGLIDGSEAVEEDTLDGELQIVIGFNYTSFDAPAAEADAEPAEEEEAEETPTELPEESEGSATTSTAEDNICS
ncbi:LCP family protein [Nocardiopsis sp. HNM0947]|uniref:LCP family protein n=1 Tax=Nocardiopsis coralli TaxID=2772213 RepID=A0ABR9P655_9ACTN|nr:LCP family protein [Nocardiopsis coralli]MBE2999319.1 LCP family protein [Nocardiopsis coralli]